MKKGYHNYPVLGRSKFIGERVIKGYKLYDSGFPVATKSPEDYVKGEVYDVDEFDGTLRQLDRLEGEGRMYNRIQDNDLQLYVGHDTFWQFKRMNEIHKNKDGVYEYSRSW